MTCAAGTREPFALEVGLHRGSAFSPFVFAIMMMFADDVALCPREKDVLDMELGQWKEALEKIIMKMSKANTHRVHNMPEWNAIRKC